MKKIIICLLMIVSISACKNANETNKEIKKTVAEESSQYGVDENKGEWQYLFDGTSTEGWRSYNKDELSEGWVLENGTLKTLGKGGDIGGDIVYGDKKFGEFELSLEWKIPAGGNSGVFYHVVEDDKYETPYMTGPEYQIMTEPVEAGRELQSIGADYGMYPSNYNGSGEELAGQWNTSRIRFTKDKVIYWLNGEKTVEFVPWSKDWENRKEEGKWSDYPDYGNAPTGLIGLQDHGSFAWFRNIKIKEL